MSGYVPPAYYVQPPETPQGPYARPWSGLAITAFVLSILGIFGVTAILGIILGIAGIYVTRGGQRRGMGLAVAAIPISLVTGAASVLIVLGLTWVYRSVTEVPRNLQPVLSARQIDAAAVADLRKLASEKLNQTLTDGQIEAWLTEVRQKYGTLAKLTFDPGTPQPPRAGTGPQPVVFGFDGQFVNGTITVVIAFDTAQDLLHRKVSDINVSGISLREMGGHPPDKDNSPPDSTP